MSDEKPMGQVIQIDEARRQAMQLSLVVMPVLQFHHGIFSALS